MQPQAKLHCTARRKHHSNFLPSNSTIVVQLQTICLTHLPATLLVHCGISGSSASVRQDLVWALGRTREGGWKGGAVLPTQLHHRLWGIEKDGVNSLTSRKQLGLGIG